MKSLKIFNIYIWNAFFLLIVILVMQIELKAQSTEAYFILNLSGIEETFVVKITDPTKIQMARDILSGKIEQHGVGGYIIKKPACYNAPWSYYLNPDSVYFFQGSIEACQATIQYVEDNLNDFNEPLLNQWCPISILVKEIPAPNCAKYAVTTVNAASYRRTGIAANSIVSTFGQNLATTTASAQVTPLPIVLAGTFVKVKDSQGIERQASLLFVSLTQINYLIPEGTAVGTAEVAITNNGGITSYGQIQIVSSSPDIFTANSDGKGVAAALVQRVKADGSMTYEPISRYDAIQKIFVPTPIDLGTDLGTKTDQVYLAIFGTGLGEQARVVGGNAVFTTSSVARESPTIYAGSQNFYAGLDQVNILLPRSLIGLGELNLQLFVEAKNSGTTDTVIRNTNFVKINIK